MSADRPRAWCRPLPASFLLLAAYAVLSLFMSPGGYLGTDTGAKVATLDVMHERGTARPVLGYWAEDLDPTGELHPIYDAALRRLKDTTIEEPPNPMLEPTPE